MNLIRRSSFSSLPSFESEMNDLMRRFFGATTTGDGWTPPARVEESDNEVLVTLELPGVEAKDVTLSVEGRELLVSGEKKLPSTEKNACLLDEIPCGTFHRRLALPAEVVGEKTAADYKAGLVRITLPKSAAARRTKIPINVTKG
jgi:HSP20 family protein